MTTELSNKLRRRKSQSGVSMIEVLVAIVIFAFGILAIAGLQLAAFKYQKGAWSRAGAATVTTDLAERMRSNITAARNGNYVLTGSYTTLISSPPSPSGCNSQVTDCSAADIAQNDLAEWFASLAQTLPNGAGTLTGSLATGFTSTVMWFDKNLIDGSGNLISSPVCSTVVTNCCPAGTPPGVRCVNSIILP